MKFIGGILDGKEFDVNEPHLNVLVKDGVWVKGPGNGVVDSSFEVQLYVKKGDVYEFTPES